MIYNHLLVFVIIISNTSKYSYLLLVTYCKLYFLIVGHLVVGYLSFCRGKYGAMLETYLSCSEKNVVSFISLPVLRANSRMTIARNKIASRRTRAVRNLFVFLYRSFSQERGAIRSQSNCYILSPLFSSRR